MQNERQAAVKLHTLHDCHQPVEVLVRDAHEGSGDVLLLKERRPVEEHVLATALGRNVPEPIGESVVYPGTLVLGRDGIEVT